jgi:hypothetical protein
LIPLLPCAALHRPAATAGNVPTTDRRKATPTPIPEKCSCAGGWLLSDMDAYKKCPYHYDGAPRPEL